MITFNKATLTKDKLRVLNETITQCVNDVWGRLRSTEVLTEDERKIAASVVARRLMYNEEITILPAADYIKTAADTPPVTKVELKERIDD